MASSRVSLSLARVRMRWESREQLRRFASLSREFEGVYRRLSRHPFGEWVTPLWAEFNAKLERSLLPRPRGDFLRDSTIKKTMFVDARGLWLASQASYLLGRVGEEELRAVLADPGVGDPPLAWARFGASHNSAHHLTHVERWAEHAGGAGAELPSRIVEWGGGYGNLARIVAARARCRGLPAPTYTIIDTPLLCAVQWIYLTAVFGGDRVCVVEDAGGGGTVREGCFNIVPVGLVDAVRPRGELFVSTWALSESSVYAQDYAARGWFGAGRLLLASQESSAELPDAGRIPGLARTAGAAIVPAPELPGNSYAFR